MALRPLLLDDPPPLRFTAGAGALLAARNDQIQLLVAISDQGGVDRRFVRIFRVDVVEVSNEVISALFCCHLDEDVAVADPAIQICQQNSVDAGLRAIDSAVYQLLLDDRSRVKFNSV
jgi:hypothetical protein